MMQRGTDLNRQNISCSICLDLLTDPTTIPCGHSYCRNCITSHWDGEDQRGRYSCPECRDRFTLRPSLQKNTTLAALVEQLKKAGLQDAPADHCYAGPGDVACDVCSGRKLKASKCCLVCQVYFCEKHLQPHYESPSFKKHKLVDPNKNLQENICSHHDEVMKIFCRTDQQIICYLCLMDEHKGHDTVSNAAERAEKQKELEESLQQIQQGIQEREKDVKLLQQEVEAISVSADEAVQDSEEIFSQLIRLIQKRSSDLKQQIRSQQETEVSRVKELQEKLEKELSELKRKDAELQKLSHTEDHNQFLHSYPSLPSPSQAAHSSSLSIRPLRYFQEVKAAVSELRDELQDILRDRWTNISQKVTNVDVLLSPEPETRAGFLRYAADITLDPDTANSHLLVSAGSRRVTYTKQAQPHRHHPDRFTYWCQALSRECLTGRCYWELDWGGVVEITVAYRSVSRAGNLDESRFGSNDRSWSLRCDTNVYEFWHNNVRVPVSGPRSSRVGVFLDHRAGILAFYSVSETTSLLHRVQTTFTQPLHAGVWLSYSEESTAELLELK